MQFTTFEKYQAASQLQNQARETMNRLEVLADGGVRKAEKLLNLAWERYSRRAAVTYKAAHCHWGDLGREGVTASSVPGSWVLADLFDVLSMSVTPDHVHEADTCFDWLTCPRCQGEGWVQVEGSAYFDARWVQWYPALAYNSAPCLRCHSDGQVLDVVEGQADLEKVRFPLAA